MLTVLAPAKLNLTLEVLAKRPDGFHEIRSVVQTISLSDTLTFQQSEAIEFRCDAPDWAAEESLVSKAVSSLQEVSGSARGVVVHISKRIPLLSGLGGDSSAAAAVLRGLNKLWGLGLSPPKLADLAAQLGSDIPLFLNGSTALLSGRGEIVTLLPAPSRMWVILLVPPLPRRPGKTGTLYAQLKTSHYTKGEATERLIARLTEDRRISSANLFNVFEKVAFDNFLGLEEYWQRFLKAGAPSVHLAGSGPTLFTLLKNKAQAEGVFRHLQGEGLECYLTNTLSDIAQIE